LPGTCMACRGGCIPPCSTTWDWPRRWRASAAASSSVAVRRWRSSAGARSTT
jgi:hypothetical protein